VQSTKTLREVLAGQAVALIVDGLLLLSYLALMIAYSPPMGLAVAAAGALQAAIYLAARPAQLDRYRERLLLDVKQEVQLLQVIRGAATLKASGREATARDRWVRALVNALNAAAGETRLLDGVGAALLLVRAAAPALVLFWGIHLVLAQRLTLGALLGFQLLQLGFLGPLSKILETLLRLAQLPLFLARMDDVLQTSPESTGGRAAPRLEGDLRLDDVSFQYGPTSPPVLRGLTLHVRPGEKVALVGASGSGKSTVARLLLGLFRPTSGRVLFDGHDLAELDLGSVRRQLGVVLQETALFDGTVRENIALQSPGAPIDDVVQAARVAQIHDDIQALPAGYETRLGPDGAGLSGGQRQRLALARAVLHRPPILILDEATSALDTITEAAIERYLASRTCTRVIIAHRLSTVRDADRILVLERGRVVEEGRHDELVARGGLYAALVARGEAPEDARTAQHRAEAIRGADLERFPTLGRLEAGERDRLARCLERRSYPAGATIVEQGERGPGLSLIESGECEVWLREPGLPALKLVDCGPGDLVGEVNLLDSSSSSAGVVARTRTTLYHLSLRRYEELRGERDPLAMHLIRALGLLVCRRVRETTERRREAGHSGAFAGQGDERAEEEARRPRAVAMRLEETPLGASLAPSELPRLAALGEVATLEPGAPLFREGDPATTVHLVLGGRVGATLAGVAGWINVIKPGDLIGEVGYFDAGVRSAGCVAIEPSTVFTIRNDTLTQLVEAGSEVAWKVLRHLTHAVVRNLRISNLRLREALARSRGEHEAAFRAREEARLLAGAREPALLDEDAGDRLPLVRAREPHLAGPACVTALLVRLGRRVPPLVVAEACSDEARVTAASLERGARSFGLRLRRLHLRLDETRAIESPLILAARGGGYLVAEGWRGGRLLVMDPASAERSLTRAEVEARFTGVCWEAGRDDASAGARSLGRRLGSWARERRAAIAQVVGVSALLQLAALGLPAATAVAIGGVLASGDAGLLGALGLALAAVVATQAALSFVRARAVLYLRSHLDRTLLDELMTQLLALPIAYFERHRASSLLQRFESFRALRNLLTTDGVGALLDLAMAGASVLALALLSPRLCAIVLGAAALHAVLLAVARGPLADAAAAELSAAAEQKNRLLESLAGIVTLRVSGDQEGGLARWAGAFARELDASVRSERGQAWVYATLEWVRESALAVVLWWGVADVQGGRLSLAALLAFSGVAAAFLSSAGSVAAQVLGLARAATRIEQLGATFREPREQEAQVVAQPGRLLGGVQLDGVSFRYAPDAPLVLDGVSLEIAPGSKVALVGASGSGKSTLGRLLLGFHLPSTGRVLFDGKDLSGLDLPSLRAQIGAVLQETFLFTGSVRENLGLNAPEAELAALVEAARAAAIHDDLDALPMKYDTVVAEGGAGFSGGQRQRLALARALVHAPAIVLLDEATSALDNVTQAAVEANLGRLACTRIVIAHRLTTVVDADLVVVLDKGRVVETGRHEELLARRGGYWRLFGAQAAS
jgi:ABC-type bacteriocin/lantibiotic exporter with double-glycine peptidase domain/CRP-like cAMP-binding protein